MQNKLNSIYFLEHSLIEWQPNNSKEAIRIRSKLKRRLIFEKILLFLRIRK